MEKYPTNVLVWGVLRSHLMEVPGDLVVWTEGETEYTAAEMLALLSLPELYQTSADVLVRWYSNVASTSFLRYQTNESV